jgi:hypothetical protein
MDQQQEFGPGFKVTTNRCRHRTTVEICSYESARVVVNPNGAFTLECSDIQTLFGAMAPTKESLRGLGMLGSFLGFGDDPPTMHEGPDEHYEQVLLFADEVSLELWLGTELMPSLVIHVDDDEELDDEVRERLGQMTRDVMVEVLGNKAKKQVRRDWGGRSRRAKSTPDFRRPAGGRSFVSHATAWQTMNAPADRLT